MERFCGTYEYALDAKGRIILPARLRAQFETKRAVVSGYIDRCLAVWTTEQFNRYLSRAEAMESRGREGRDLARTLSAMSTEVEIDGQWRLTIPGNLRSYAGLEPDKPVSVIGANSRIELWRPEAWAQRQAASLEALASGANPIFDEASAASMAQATQAPWSPWALSGPPPPDVPAGGHS